MYSKLLLAALVGLTYVVPAKAFAADPSFPRVCRGTSIWAYDNEIKRAVRQTLKNAKIDFKWVAVQYLDIVRTHDKHSDDFTGDLTLNGGTEPSISFSGAFPDLTPCTVSLKVKLTIAYPDGTKAITITPATVQGSMLPPLGPRRLGTDE